jgi:hypothetical protein
MAPPTESRRSQADSPRSLRSRLVGAAIIVLVILGLSPPSPIRAASPSPIVPTDKAAYANLQAWLDAPLAPDAAEGTPLEIGVTIWDTHDHVLAHETGSYVRLRPATGDARPTEAVSNRDWPGHVRATIVVPPGGPGPVEVGLKVDECTTAGVCRTVDRPFSVGGGGPPPDAPRASLIDAALQPLPPSLAGQVIALNADVTPHGVWPLDALKLPAALVAIVRAPGSGPDVASVELRRRGVSGLTYSGRLTIAAPGTYDVTLAVPGGGSGGEDQAIDGSATSLTVIPPTGSSGTGGLGTGAAVGSGEPARSPTVSTAAAARDESSIPVPWIVVALITIGGATLLSRRFLADL